MKIKLTLKEKNIQDIQVGDTALTHSGLETVLETFSPLIKKEDQHKISLSNGDFFICSSYHRMMINNKWTAVRDAKNGDIITSLTDHREIVMNEVIGEYDEVFYDLHINNDHSYYIKGGKQYYLSHNSANVNIPWWHYEIEDVLALKNNAGTDDNRVRKLDYTIQFDKIFYERLIKNEEITLFSPHEVSDLYEAFGDNLTFKTLYEKYERSKNIKMKKKISARKLAEIFAKERLETGRIYSMNIDNVNEHGSWSVPVKMTNLCVEILHHTKPISSIDDKDGEIGICILSAINLLELDHEEDIQSACSIAVRTLENIIDYQDYPVAAGENFTKNRRSLGIGITNLAGYLAKNKLKYDDPDTLKLVHKMMEKIQWNLLNESCKLAEKLGPCNKFSDTKYSKGLLPIDWYKKTVDELVKPEYTMDWEGLRSRIKTYGLRHSTLTAIMPCESCLKWDTLVITPVGKFNFHDLASTLGFDPVDIETNNRVGWYVSDRSVEICTKDSVLATNKIFYNGHKDVSNIELEDGTTLKATMNHKFLIRTTDGVEIWKRVYELVEGDDIINILLSRALLMR